ncbi:MAG: YceI-like domain-containing protein [Rhodobacteraceae bacterium HLUCCA24]|nr:MAG: YceI-like domain-containing protein [Rhodobacteraceae bacterium HLUCCA24]
MTKTRIAATRWPAMAATAAAFSLAASFASAEPRERAEPFLNVIDHPKITFESTEITQTGEMTGTMTGDLMLVGEMRPATFDVAYNGTGPHLSGRYQIDGFGARTKIDRQDFGMSAFSPRVGGEIGIPIQMEGTHSHQ